MSSTRKIKIEELSVWDSDLSLGAKLLWLCHYSRADIEHETVRGTLALLEEPEAYTEELMASGWVTAEGNSLHSVVPATA